MSGALKFFQHYVHVAAAMKRTDGRAPQLWDEQDGFFYDVLRYPDGNFEKFRVRSLVGLIPLYAIERLEQFWIDNFPDFKANVLWVLRNQAHLTRDVCHVHDRDGITVLVCAIVNRRQTEGLLCRVLDPEEFMSTCGLRSLSRYHAAHPFRLGERTVQYEPAEAASMFKGGNSNWRGPVWFPTSFLMIEALRKLGRAYGDAFTVPADGREGARVTLSEAARQIADRMISLFTRDANGRRPFYGRARKLPEDPHWRDLILFYEYFHGDTGEGLGASHQTGWTGLVASLIDEWRRPPGSPR